MIYFVVRSISILSRNRVCVVTNVFNITGSKKHYFIVMEKLLSSKTNNNVCIICQMTLEYFFLALGKQNGFVNVLVVF